MMAKKNTIEIIINAKDETGKALKGVGSQLQSLGKVALGAAGIVTGALAGLGAGIAKLAIDAAPLQAVRGAFEGLAESAGTGTDEMLAALQKGSAGMVSQRDLMMSFNKAAGLVSLDFAQKLPDAMGMLGKVAASTGQDVGFMLDSLITGVGRLSPMILDNLNIQVSLAEATEKAASMFGVEASELTKAQQQAGMMEVVLAKLGDTTEAMPDIAGSATAGIAGLKAMFTDIKDEIGTAFLPILNRLMGIFSALVSEIWPKVSKWLTRIAGVITGKVTKAFDKFTAVTEEWGGIGEYVTSIIGELIALFTGFGEDTYDTLDAVQELAGIFGLSSEEAQAFTDTLWELGERVREVVDVVRPYIEQAWEWITQNVQLKDVLIGLAVAVATVVIPVLWTLLSPVLAIIAIFVAVVAVVAALRAAWESDFLGIRTALTEFWEGTAKPALAQLWEWLKVNIPAAIATLKKFWEDKLLPALETVWAFIQDNVIPILVDVATTAKEFVGEAITKLTEIWETVLLPILEMVWGFIQESVIPLFEELAEIAEIVLGLAISVLAKLWEETLWPALEKVWAFIQDNIIPIFLKLKKKIDEDLGPVLQWMADVILPAIEKFFNLIAEAVEWVIAQLKTLKEWLKKVAAAWEGSGMSADSPSIVETAVRGIADAVADLAKVELPALEASLGVTSSAAMATAGAGGGGGDTSYTFSMTVQPGEFSASDVIMGYEQMRALVGA